MTPEQIEKKAQEYADKKYKWPKNNKGEEMAQIVGHANPPFYKKQTTPFKTGYIDGALSRQPEIDQLKERVEKISILLHDLTPGGSEFANDPEYCAKWIRENRQEESMSLKKIIVSQKQRIKELEEGLKSFKKMADAISNGLKHPKNGNLFSFNGVAVSYEDFRNIQQLLTNKPNNNG